MLSLRMYSPRYRNEMTTSSRTLSIDATVVRAAFFQVKGKKGDIFSLMSGKRGASFCMKGAIF